MNITVAEATGLPEKAFISIRVGDQRKQVQYKPGERFCFDISKVPRHFMVDIFEKVGSKQVSLSDMDISENDGCKQWRAPASEIANRDGATPVSLDVNVKLADGKSVDVAAEARRTSRHEAALQAKKYLDCFSVQQFLQSMVHALLAQQPADPFAFMGDYIQKKGSTPKPTEPFPSDSRFVEHDEEEDPLPDWSMRPGLGDHELPGFAVDGSDPLPNLEGYNSVATAVLRENTSIYDTLAYVRTEAGATLAKCIKPGIDVKGHSFVRSVGLVAADEMCYKAFEEIFDPVIERWHEGFHFGDVHISGEEALTLPSASGIDPVGSRVLSVQVVGRRNLKGLRMPTSMSVSERRETERLISRACLEQESEFAGRYCPLRGSTSFIPRPTGMSAEEENELRTSRVLFCAPTSSVPLSAGLGRNWPHGRGVYVGEGEGFSISVNEEDHIKITVRQPGAGLRETFERFLRLEAGLIDSLAGTDVEFAYDDRLGYLTVCPSNLGGICATAMVSLPLLSQTPNFKQRCRNLGLKCRNVTSFDHCCIWTNVPRGSVMEVSCIKRLGVPESLQVFCLADGCRLLIEEDLALEGGDAEHEGPLLGERPIGFPIDVCPAVMPNLQGSCSLAATVMRSDPTIYPSLRELVTPSGVPFATCVKTCFDNPGHPMIKTVGLVAGDEQCYDTFRMLFDPVIALRHTGFNFSVERHPADMSLAGVESVGIGARAISVGVRLVRNLQGLRMAPACSREERCNAERLVVGAFRSLPEGVPHIRYFALRGSRSFKPQPNGMDKDDETRLRTENLLPEVPDSDLLLSSGHGLAWPEARGVLASENREFVATVNEEDHLRMTVTQSGGDLKAAFEMMCRIHDSAQASLKVMGSGFARSSRLGFLGCCPSNLGTCLTAWVTLRLPRLIARRGFRSLCKRFGLVVRSSGSVQFVASCGGEAGADLVELSNAERLGTSEVQHVNAVLTGCRLLSSLEDRLEDGEDVDVEALALPLVNSPLDNLDISEIPGLGAEDYPGFPSEAGLEAMPNLTRHHSLAAKVLCEDPSIYARLLNVKTKLGTSFARCIKPAMDNPGHPMIRTVGAMAGDSECYETFSALFDPIISLRHGVRGVADLHPTDLNHTQVPSDSLDPTGSYVVSVRVSAARNIAGFPMPAAASPEQRQHVEQLLASSLYTSMAGVDDLSGDYYPLRGSSSYAAKPGGMTDSEELRLSGQGFLFRAPDAKLMLSAGVGRCWPAARGVWAARGGGFAAWINQEDHLRLFSARSGSDLAGAFCRFALAEAALRKALQSINQDFGFDRRLGFLTADPSNLGTALRAEVAIRIPLAATRQGFRTLCRCFGVQAAAAVELGAGVWVLSNAKRLGSSETDQVMVVSEATRFLVSVERRLNDGEDVKMEDLVKQIEAEQADQPSFADVPGLGDTDTPGFPTEDCPVEMPNLSEHCSLMACVLSKNPGIYSQLRELRTKSGVTLARCIKPGMDHRGHDMIRTIGAVAGDAECYELFSPIFDPIIASRHISVASSPRRIVGSGADCQKAQNTAFSAPAPAGLDIAQATSIGAVDPSGKFVVSARVKASRNLQGHRFPSAVDPRERETVEGVLTKALSVAATTMGLKAVDYHPLRGSTTYSQKPLGMNSELEAELDKDGLLFMEPDSALTLASGVGRNWPEARGVFVNAERSFAAFVNQEEHLTFIATEGGDNLAAAFGSLCRAEAATAEALKQGEPEHVYARTERLGFLATCPSKTGTGGFKASVLMRLPLLGNTQSFKSTCRESGVAARPTNTEEWGNVWNISANSRFGLSEAAIVQQVADACRQFASMEEKLQLGQ
eukprot:TRINITY_DN14771_c0_g1_i2.p1 TRINITY_DN14771_c0_g1~~TRINITY_DN14771_c0_g1_i2.p1  ORF type:complete len:1817 (+),score=313.81 TRINITY_DN14771_c0_g1_i2:54-5504(+)